MVEEDKAMPLTIVRIQSQIEIDVINPFIPVSAKQASRLKLNWRRPMPVIFWVDGKKPYSLWRVNLMPIGDGTFRLYLNGRFRKASNVDLSDSLAINLRFDDEYRNGPLHPMPFWFRGELNRNLLARQGWDHLSPSRQKEILRYFAGLQSTEAKERNLQRALHVLSGGQGRFMARFWNEKMIPVGVK